MSRQDKQNDEDIASLSYKEGENHLFNFILCIVRNSILLIEKRAI